MHNSFTKLHGRVKVKTTAQQEEEKKKEREKKLKIYVAARDACFAKRKEGIKDEEALELTQQLLSSNPDFATLWNQRREILMHLETIKDEDEMQKIYESELHFLESCLKVNPKSYGSWFHRGWVSARLPRPNWVRELSLCDRCLSLDDRNFHCWDYRRMVVKMSGVPVEKELEFTDRLIGSNFSNYSSWHYRSTLLPLLHPESPDPKSSGDPPSSQAHSHRVCEEQLLKEYELVQNAFFTDPNDQSAWFYYRWLLGRADREEMISCVYVSRDEERVVVGFSRPVNVNVFILFVEVILECLAVVLLFSIVLLGTIQWSTNVNVLVFRSELSVEKTSVLQSELQSCNQLQELEPLNKWCLLTIILLMRALDPLRYEKETLAHFETLKEVDPMRSAYYSDLCSKFMIENTILKMEYAEVRVFSISDKNLTTLCHLDQLVLVTHINLSSNQLHRLPLQFAMLQCLEVLEADSNLIENLEGLYHLPNLEEVLLRNNNLQPLASCPKLKHLDLRGNPVTLSDGIEAEIKALLPSVTKLLL
uniref:Geranylgeranyl transferase type-2 subunit alpha n=1 Tax=Periophthalmus magnuspinnatus TaxID=409849 RepID=A0A3B3ZY69_9GOBI